MDGREAGKPRTAGRGVKHLKKYDAIVVGAGVTGLSTAFNLISLRPDLSICVVEAGNGIATGNSSKSASGFRTSFTSDVNRKLARSTADYFIRVSSKGADIGLRQVGYLYLIADDRFAHFSSVAERLNRNGSALRIIDAGSLEKMIPGIVVEPASEDAEIMGLHRIGGGIFDPVAGIMDPVKVCEHYYAAALAGGVDFLFNTRVQEFITEADRPLGIPGEPFGWQKAQVGGVKTARGDIRGRVIVAAGTWAPDIVNAIGVDARARPKTRQIFVLRGQQLADLYHNGNFSTAGTLPFTFLPGGVYLRPETSDEAFDIGFADDFGRRFGFEEYPAADESFFEMNIHPVLSEYLPVFSSIRPSGSWAGQYIINTFDSNPIIFEEYGMITVTGMSGSGILKSYAIGRIAASLFLGIEEADLGNGISIRTDELGYRNRHVQAEELVF
ncbi:MAG: FAD-binding oxidoreductase [Thermoplasmata archaeon]|uniref:FAD-binding oxidoreductase n=1 Tax=Candidatus Sysuiplasma superficiale TaxID=2823368 RepID=A0A8J7YUX4_9ARCH|nr:FAD-binding oxidoreductase [Candidatus Sysuiplasma superficiale]MBX8643369.1 FAD-binding oxidoreductase [Candidatus Sysuiplasma superficiale]MCL4347431.1 FAD-binding oxidoreductase [Candidatus Thermoplasmatota archaeon]